MDYFLYKQLSDWQIPPSCLAVAAFICGIITQFYIPFSTIFFQINFFILALSLFYFFWYRPKPFLSSIIVLLFFTLLGATRFSMQDQYFKQKRDDLLLQREGIVGTVVDCHEVSVHGMHTYIKIKLNSTQQFAIVESAFFWPTYIAIYTNNKDLPQIGDTIKVFPHSLKKGDSKKFEQYLIRQNTLYTLFEPKNKYELIYSPSWSFARSIHTTKHRILDHLKSKMSPQTYGFFTALFLGNRTAEKEQKIPISNNFKNWGIAHLFARSGIHLALFIFLWSLLLRIIPLPFSIKNGLLLVLVLVYHFLSWESISFLRALYTFILCKTGSIFRIPIHTSHILALTCFFILMNNPIELFFLDFQLSFCLTGGLTWIINMLNRLHPRRVLLIG